MRVETLAEIEAAFVERAHRAVWCTLATVGVDGRPRSRLVHPVWEGMTGWVGTRRGSPKSADLTGNPHVSLAYVADVVRPVYADCLAAWEDDPAVRCHVWALVRSFPPPLGYDPAPIYGHVDDPGFGLLRLTPYRVALEDVSGQGERRVVWRADPAECIPPTPSPNPPPPPAGGGSGRSGSRGRRGGRSGCR